MVLRGRGESQRRGFMASSVKKRSVVYTTHKTSVSLEDDFWEAINHIAQIRHVYLGDLVGMIESERGQANLSSAIRLFVLDYYRSRSGKEGPGVQMEHRSPETRRSTTNQTTN